MLPKERPLNNDFNMIATIRTAIIFNGMRLDPSDTRLFMRCYVAVMKDDFNREASAAEQDWRLFTVEHDNPCLVHRVWLAQWFMDGIVEMAGEDYPVEKIPVRDWIEGLANTLAKLPRGFIEEEAIGIAGNIELSAHKITSTNNANEIQRAVLEKGRALRAAQNGSLMTRCPTLDDLERAERSGQPLLN